MSEKDVAGGAAEGADDLGDLKVSRGKNVAFGVVVIIILLGGGGAGIWYGFLREDPAAAHETFRREVFGTTHSRYYQTFWQCALTVPESDFTKNSELTAKILQNAGAGDASRYSEHLQKSENCIPLLTEAIPEYRALKTHEKTPPEYAPLLEKLAGNVESIQSSWTTFAEFQGKASKRNRLRERINLRGKAYAGYEGAVEQNDAERRTKYQGNAVSYYQYLQCVLGDQDYTAYEGDPEGADAAHYKLVAHLDQQCAQNKAAFVERLTVSCAEKLFPAAPPEPTEDFEKAVAHWVKQGGDYGSAVPLDECLGEYEEFQTKELVADITKAWYDYRSTYREIFDLSKTKTGSIFERGRQPGSSGGGGASEEGGGE